MTRSLLVLVAAAASLGVALFVLTRPDPPAGPLAPDAPGSPRVSGAPAVAADLVPADVPTEAAPAARPQRTEGPLPSPAATRAPGPSPAPVAGSPEMWFAPEHKVITAATARIFRPDGTVEERQIRVEATPVYSRAGLARIDPVQGVQPVAPEASPAKPGGD